MEEVIQASIIRVVDFYKELGISIDRYPSFTYLDEYSPHGKPFGALVINKSWGEDLEIYLKSLFLKYMPQWYQRLGLEISKEAVEEYFEAFSRKIGSLRGDEETGKRLLELGKDIVYFKGLKEFFNENPGKEDYLIDCLNSHELWHCVEMQLGILNDFISEGTADYLREEFYKSIKHVDIIVPSTIKDNDPRREYFDKIVLRLLYRTGYRIVRRHAKYIHDVLDSEKRILMEEEFKRYMDQLASDFPTKLYCKKRGLLSRLIFPELDILDQRRSKQNLATALTQTGAVLLAKELNSQKLSKLLEYHRRIGYIINPS